MVTIHNRLLTGGHGGVEAKWTADSTTAFHALNDRRREKKHTHTQMIWEKLIPCFKVCCSLCESAPGCDRLAAAIRHIVF